MKRFLLITTLCLLLLPLTSCGKDKKNINDTASVQGKSEDARSKMDEVPWYGELPTKENETDGEEDIDLEKKEEPLPIEGEYSFYYDGDSFSDNSEKFKFGFHIKKNEEEDYYQIIMYTPFTPPMYECTGNLYEDLLFFYTAEPSGWGLSGTINFNNSYTPLTGNVTFDDGTEWGDVLNKHKLLRFSKESDTPNMEMKWDNYIKNPESHDKYEGEYFSYTSFEPSLEIKKNNDDTYTINVNFHRNVNYGSNSYYNLSGIEMENGIEIFSTENTKTNITEYGETSREEFEEKQIKGSIIYENNSIIAEVSIFGMDSEQYYKTNNIPDMDYIRYND